MVSLLLTLNRFQTLLSCFHCCIWISESAWVWFTNIFWNVMIQCCLIVARLKNFFTPSILQNQTQLQGILPLHFTWTIQKLNRKWWWWCSWWKDPQGGYKILISNHFNRMKNTKTGRKENNGLRHVGGKGLRLGGRGLRVAKWLKKRMAQRRVGQTCRGAAE